jgi:protein TonB
MSNSQLLRNCIALSVLFHLTVMAMASLYPLSPYRTEDVMVVDLADLPRSVDFPRPKPGIVKGARPKPPPPPKPVREEKPRFPPPRELSGRVPDLPVNPDLPPEKEFPVPRSKEEPPPPGPTGEKPLIARAGETPKTTGESPPAPSKPPPPAPSKSLREITPSLGKMVMAKASPRASRGGGTHLTALNAPEIQYISYFASIKRKIELVWQYPQEAAVAGIQGTLTVDFVIGRNGTLQSVQLLRGSGYKILDDEALGSIRKAAPYNPIPENYTIPDLRIRARFIYEMHTLTIR